MKRIRSVLLLACLILTFLMAGCASGNKTASSSENTEETGVVFRGTIIEIENGSMLVKPDDDSDEMASSDQFRIPVEHLASTAEPASGDSIEVVYSGVIEELYPALLKDITSISVVKSGNDQ